MTESRQRVAKESLEPFPSGLGCVWMVVHRCVTDAKESADTGFEETKG
jgi:hypothetical protein